MGVLRAVWSGCVAACAWANEITGKILRLLILMRVNDEKQNINNSRPRYTAIIE